MTKLRLSPDLTIPEDVVTSTVVVYGGKGMGKTNFGSVLVGAPGTTAELHERVFRKISEGQRRILQHLIDIYPETISRADLGKQVGYNLTGGSGAQHVADLITVGAAVIPAQGKVAASDLLFPEGLD